MLVRMGVFLQVPQMYRDHPDSSNAGTHRLKTRRQVRLGKVQMLTRRFTFTVQLPFPGAAYDNQWRIPC